MPNRTAPRGRGRPKKELLTFERSFVEGLQQAIAETTTLQWPSPKYQRDILGFAHDILGIKPWSRQREMLLAIQDNRKIAVRAGRKCSKTCTVAIAALWHYCSFENSKVAITGPGGETVGSVVYDEICRLQNRSGICVQCREAGVQEAPCLHSAIITGDQSPDFRYGVRAKDRRRIYGYAVKKAGASRGVSGSALFLIADEASEVDDQVFEILLGNAASSQSTRILLTGNPSKITGFFFNAFHTHKHLWKLLHISSRESPNVTGECNRIDGLADADWIAEQAQMYGEQSPQFLVDVEGEFSSLAESRPFTEEVLRDAMARHATQPAIGRLHIGIDVAGPKGTGDSTVLAARRGLKVLELQDARGSDELQILELALDTIERLHLRDSIEIPVIVLDSEAAIGARVRRTFDAHLSEHPKAFELVPFRGSEPAVRDPRSFATKRDELYFNFTQWIAKGGALPPDSEQLKDELRHFLWVEGRGKNKTRAIPKINWQRQIKRSPDSADAVALSCWQDSTAWEELQVEVVKKGSAEWWAREEERMFEAACERAAKKDSVYDHMFNGEIPDLGLPRRW